MRRFAYNLKINALDGMRAAESARGCDQPNKKKSILLLFITLFALKKFQLDGVGAIYSYNVCVCSML